MTNKERLKHPCPQCHAKAGDPCVDPRGDATARPHKTRGPGQHEKHLQERIDRQVAREKASYGPLFQFVAEAEVRVPTVEEVNWNDRMAHARSFDETGGPIGMALTRQCNKGIECIFAWHLAHELERRIGEAGRLFGEASLRTYPLDYQRMIFKELMTTTKRQQIGPHRVPAENSLGFTIAYRYTWEPAAPLMTAEEFDRLFPRPDHYAGLADAPEPDDGGLFERTIGVLNGC